MLGYLKKEDAIERYWIDYYNSVNRLLLALNDNKKSTPH